MPDVLGRLQTALADRYAVESEVGRGGMATVFRAEDLKHRRQVAIKVLHPDLAAALGGDRFLREIEIAASLNHPHILPLFDSGEAAGLLFYVMPYVEGESLQERLEAEVQLPIDQAVAIAAEVAEGLDYAHRQGVIHRDIKPGNILLSEGHALITDFGIARAIGAATDAEAQTPGLALGTPAYMSPEQGAPAAEVDGRSDVYALGCVLWEMLAGEPPFGGPTPQVILARKAVEEAPDVRGIRGRVPEALGACLEGALAPVPADRFATAAEFASALRNAVLLGVTPQAVARRRRKQRRRWVLAAASVIVAAGGVLAWQTYVARRQVEWARTEAQPEIRRLAGEGKYDSATSVAIRLESILPDEPTLDVPWEYFSHSMTIETEPPGASVYRRPNEAETDTTWQLLGTTPIEGVRLPHIRNRFRFEKEGYDPREFPFDGERIGLVVLDPEHSTPDGMVRVHHFRLESDFYIDVHEVTNRQYKRFVDAGGYRSEEYWVEPFDLDGQTVPLVEAMALLVDRTGRPGPSTWEAGAFPPGQADFPVGGISWYEATAYARFAGRSLPSVRHLRYALRVGTQFGLIRRSNLDGTGPQAVGFPQTEGPFGAFDQYGNVREWAYNAREDGRLSFGGSWAEAWGPPDDYDSRILSPWDRSPENGMRLVLAPDSVQAARMSEPLEPREPTRDYWSESPAGDSVYETYARLYDYEPAALDPVVELADTVNGWPMERVSFTGPGSGGRMGVYLFLPEEGRPPYQTILFFNGYAQDSPALDAKHTIMFDYFLRSGRAVAVPILYGTYEPYDPLTGVEQDWFYQSPEIVIRWVRELRRAVDYLEARPDMDARRLAYYGMFIGATHSPIFLATEPRIKVAFTETGALVPLLPSPPPEVDPFQFLPRVRTPIAIMNGRYSGEWPYEASQLPMLDYLGTAPEHRRLVAGVGDPVPFSEVVPIATPWYEEYLGSVEGF